MTFYRLRLHWIIGTVFILLFAILLALRLGSFQPDESGLHLPTAVPPEARDREIWMTLLQHDQRIGYVHRQFFRTAEGYRIRETAFMRLQVMGMVQDVRFRTEGDFHPDLILSSFDFELGSSLSRFKARGVLKGGLLTLFTGEKGSEQRIDLPIQKETLLPMGLLETVTVRGLRPGEFRTFHVFDPATLGQRPVKVSVLDEETIVIMGRQELARKVSVDFMGAPQFAWIGKDGTALREEGSLGIKLERTTREEALKQVALSPGEDIAEIASIPADKMLDHPDQLQQLKLKLDGIPVKDFSLEGDRQSLEGSVLTIRREPSPSLHLPRAGEVGLGKEERRYLEPTPMIQSDHAEIQRKVREIVFPEDSNFTKAKKLVKWVNENIQKRPVLSVPNALETLRHRVGDCNEHAVLLAALARAAGVPAEVEAGLVYQRGRFYYHAWNVLDLGTWVTADSVMGQLPADVTHIRFARGMESQIDLMGVIGRLRLQILEGS